MPWLLCFFSYLLVQFLKNSVSTVLARSPVLYDEDLAPFERRACATAYSFAELEKVIHALPCRAFC